MWPNKKLFLGRRACTSLPPQEELFLCTPFVAQILIPRSRKSGYRLLVGCRSALHRVFDKTTFFGDVRTKKWLETRKFFTGCSDTLSQSIGRGRISRVRSIVLNETVIVEIGVIKFCATPPPQFWPEILEQKQQFCPGNFHFFGRGRANFGGGGGV